MSWYYSPLVTHSCEVLNLECPKLIILSYFFFMELVFVSLDVVSHEFELNELISWELRVFNKILFLIFVVPLLSLVN